MHSFLGPKNQSLCNSWWKQRHLWGHLLIVGLPLFANQPHNNIHMKAKEAAVILDLETISRKDFLSALKEVINNPLWIFF